MLLQEYFDAKISQPEFSQDGPRLWNISEELPVTSSPSKPTPEFISRYRVRGLVAAIKWRHSIDEVLPERSWCFMPAIFDESASLSRLVD